MYLLFLEEDFSSIPFIFFSKHYGDLRTASVFEIQPESLKRGLLVAVYNPLEPKCKWSRAIILAKLSSTDYRVSKSSFNFQSGIILLWNKIVY